MGEAEAGKGSTVDCLVVGSGPAGLAAAIQLGRLRRSSVIVDVRGAVGECRHAAGQIQALGMGDGTLVECEMVFVSTPKRPRTELARRLGARADAGGYLETDDAGRTTVPGLYAAGDATAGHSHQVTTAAHLGAKAARRSQPVEL